MMCVRVMLDSWTRVEAVANCRSLPIGCYHLLTHLGVGASRAEQVGRRVWANHESTACLRSHLAALSIDSSSASHTVALSIARNQRVAARAFGRS